MYNREMAMNNFLDKDKCFHFFHINNRKSQNLKNLQSNTTKVALKIRKKH